MEVVHGGNAEGVTDWLRENGLHFDRADVETFKEYASRGWCFITAKVPGPRDEAGNQLATEGIVGPLILRFQATAPIYPLGLTATDGVATEVLVYTLSENKLSTGSRLALRAATETNLSSVTTRLLVFAQEKRETEAPFADVPDRPMMLCKFKGRLTAEQMREDLEFVPAADNQPYRERKIVW